LYLPQHLQFILNRAWFYVHGDSSDMHAAAADVVKEAVRTLAHTAVPVAEATASVVKEL
jgi:hypothetical protein